MSDELWQQYLKPDEREVLQEVDAWSRQPQNLLGKAITFLGRPMGRAFELVPEGVKERLATTIYTGLLAARVAAGFTVSKQALLDRISAHIGLDVGTAPRQILRANVRQLDQVARGCLNFHRNAGAVQGGAAGATGLLGFVGDIPALYTLLYRCIQEIGICYGFAVDTPAEEAFMLKVLDIGHFLEDDRRRQGLQDLLSLQDMIRTGVPLQDIERFAVAKGLEALARRLASALATRKAGQAVALVGSVIGASVNYQLLSDVGTVAWQAYRRRFVLEVAHHRMIREGATTVALPVEGEVIHTNGTAKVEDQPEAAPEAGTEPEPERPDIPADRPSEPAPSPEPEQDPPTTTPDP